MWLVRLGICDCVGVGVYLHVFFEILGISFLTPGGLAELRLIDAHVFSILVLSNVTNIQRYVLFL